MKNLALTIVVMILIGLSYRLINPPDIAATPAIASAAPHVMPPPYELQKKISQNDLALFEAMSNFANEVARQNHPAPPSTCTTSYYQSPRLNSAAEVTTTCR